MLSKLLSIVISSHNNEDTIKRCIESFYYKVQDYDVEIICIDDHSTDNTINIISKYPHVKLKKLHQYGLGASRNEGIHQSNGKLIWFIDADDTINKANLDQKFFDLLSNKKADMFLLGFNKKYGMKAKLTANNITEFVNVNSDSAKQLFRENILNNSWNKIYKREIIIKNKLSFVCYPSIEDIMFNCDYFKHISNIQTISLPLYNYFVYSKTSTKYTWHSNQEKLAKLLLTKLVDVSKTSNLVNKEDLFENMVNAIIGLQINIFNKFKGSPTLKEYYDEQKFIRLNSLYKFSKFTWCGLGYTLKYIISKNSILSFMYIKSVFFNN